MLDWYSRLTYDMRAIQHGGAERKWGGAAASRRYSSVDAACLKMRVNAKRGKDLWECCER